MCVCVYEVYIELKTQRYDESTAKRVKERPIKTQEQRHKGNRRKEANRTEYYMTYYKRAHTRTIGIWNTKRKKKEEVAANLTNIL